MRHFKILYPDFERKYIMQKKDYYSMMDLINLLLQKIWFIIIIGVVCAVGAFVYSAFIITPMYESSVRLYVNSSSISLGSANINISPNELSVSESLVDVYLIILTSKPTLNEIIETADLDYTHEELKEMISGSSVNDTGVFEVTVTSPDPKEAEKIANCVLEVLPDKVSEVIDGTSVSLVDYAEVPEEKSYPNITKFTILGLAAGILAAVLIVLIIDMQDDVIHSEDFLTKNFPNVPIMAAIPDLTESLSDDYGSYERGYAHASDKKKKSEEAR